jgi:plastocyanin
MGNRDLDALFSDCGRRAVVARSLSLRGGETGMRRTQWILAAAPLVLAACNGLTSPYSGYGGGGGGGGGGPVGHVTVGNTYFRSAHNGTQNPAVDTIAPGGSITWTWNVAAQHSVQSTGTPSFPSSAVLSAQNGTYVLTFNTAGTYTYDCAIHGSAMTGRIVVR